MLHSKQLPSSNGRSEADASLTDPQEDKLTLGLVEGGVE